MPPENTEVFGVIIDPKGAVIGSAVAARSIRSIGTEAEVTTARMGKSFANLKTIIASTFAVTAVTLFFRKALREMQEFERGVVGVAKTTGLAGRELRDFIAIVEGMERRLPITSDRLLEVAQAAGQLGVKGADNLEKFTETIVRMESASDLAGEEGAKALARILNVTGEAITDVDRLASSIVGLGNDAAASESEIAHMTRRVALGIARFGAGATEIAGMSTAMVEMGIRAELGGTQMSRAFSTIAEAIAVGGEDLEILTGILGKTHEQLREAFQVDPIRVFQQALHALSLAGEGDILILNELGLTGTEVQNVLLALSEDTDKFNNRIRQSIDLGIENLAVYEESEQAFGTAAAKVILFENAWAQFARTYGETLKPTFEGTLQFLTATVNTLETFFTQLNRITGILSEGDILRSRAIQRIIDIESREGGLLDRPIRATESRIGILQRAGVLHDANLEAHMRDLLREEMALRQRFREEFPLENIVLPDAGPVTDPDAEVEDRVAKIVARIRNSLKSEGEFMLREYDEVADGLERRTGQAAHVMEGAFDAFGQRLVRDFSNVGAAFTDMVQQMLVDWANMIFQMGVARPITSIFQNLLGGLIGGISGGVTGGFFGNAGIPGGVLRLPASTAAIGVAPIAHRGGVIGSDTFPTRPVSTTFPGASTPRFHSGGIAGEVPAILKMGEGVFTPEQMRRLSPVRGGPINITSNTTITIDRSGASADSDTQTSEQTGRRIGEMITQRINRSFLEEAQPGGLIYQTIYTAIARRQ